MKRAAHLCPNCGAIVPGGQRCAACEQARRKIDNQKRNPKNKKIYGSEWAAFRVEHLRLYPRCVDCGARAEQVDHVIPIAQGGARLDHANCASRCISCHSKKTASADGGFGNPIKKDRIQENGFEKLQKWVNGEGG